MIPYLSAQSVAVRAAGGGGDAAEPALAAHYSLLPPDSYHMTTFDIISGKDYAAALKGAPAVPAAAPAAVPSARGASEGKQSSRENRRMRIP